MNAYLVELLIDHYLDLLNSNENRYGEMIRTTYASRQKYLSFLNRLQKAEQEVIQAAITSMKRGSKQERLAWFRRVEEVSKEARGGEVEQIFQDV